MNVTLFPGVTYAIKRNAGVNKSSPRNSIPGNVALEINLSKLISRNPSRIAWKRARNETISPEIQQFPGNRIFSRNVSRPWKLET